MSPCTFLLPVISGVSSSHLQGQTELPHQWAHLAEGCAGRQIGSMMWRSAVCIVARHRSHKCITSRCAADAGSYRHKGGACQFEGKKRAKHVDIDSVGSLPECRRDCDGPAGVFGVGGDGVGCLRGGGDAGFERTGDSGDGGGVSGAVFRTGPPGGAPCSAALRPKLSRAHELPGVPRAPGGVRWNARSAEDFLAVRSVVMSGLRERFTANRYAFQVPSN
jgi:hypothetical protein